MSLIWIKLYSVYSTLDLSCLGFLPWTPQKHLFQQPPHLWAKFEPPVKVLKYTATNTDMNESVSNPHRKLLQTFILLTFCHQGHARTIRNIGSDFTLLFMSSFDSQDYLIYTWTVNKGISLDFFLTRWAHTALSERIASRHA